MLNLSLFQWLAILLVFTFLVFIHELGHFLMARFHKVRVEEFGLGIPPRVWGKKIGHTLYSINLLPFGGFVRLWGEDPAETNLIKDPHSFIGKKPRVRAQILLAGVFMNFVFGVVSLAILFHTGVPVESGHPVVQAVLQDSLAQQIGLHPLDEIISINDKEVVSPTDLINVLTLYRSQPVRVLIIRDKGELTLNFNLTAEGKLGVEVANRTIGSYGWFESVRLGLDRAQEITIVMLRGFGTFLRVLVFEHRLIEGVAGPVGIAGIIAEAVNLGWLSVIEISGIISLNLALLNILPLPALDGGRLFFVLGEMLTRKRISANIEHRIHIAGFMLLLLLILLLTFSDILKIL